MRLFFIAAIDDNGEDMSQFVVADTASEAIETYWRDGCQGDMPNHPPVIAYEMPKMYGFLTSCVIEWEDLHSVKG